MSAPPTTIDALAPETLDRIMELIRDPVPPWEDFLDAATALDDARSWSTQSSATLLAASLVCRMWRDPAQRVLWTELRPGNTSVAWLSSPARGRYMTRELWIHIEEGDRVETLEEALSTCAGLRGLSVSSEEGVAVPWGMFSSPGLAGALLLRMLGTT